MNETKYQRIAEIKPENKTRGMVCDVITHLHANRSEAMRRTILDMCGVLFWIFI